MTRFTIITVTYNAAGVLSRTLDSVLRQSYEAVEHLIVDGASSDATLQIAEAYKRKSDASASGHKVIVRSEADEGIYDAMNKGLSQASGTYVVFLNAGDFLPQDDTLEQIARRCHLNELPSAELPAVVYGKTDIVDDEGRYLRPRRLQPPSRLSWKSFRKGMLVCHQAFYARTDLAKNAQYDRCYRFSADFDWCLRLLKEAGRAALPVVDSGITLACYTEQGQTTLHHRASLRERFSIMTVHYGWPVTVVMHAYFLVRAIFLR